ncbi:hypothetical protein ACWF5H_05280 [Arthrobacter sp. NPDC055138]
MTPTVAPVLQLADVQVAADLKTYVSRARAAGESSIHLQAFGSVLAAYVCLMRPRILGESTPTILGLRVMPLAAPAAVEETVPLAAVGDRLARMGNEETGLAVPPTTLTESWTGVLPPRSGWEHTGVLDSAVLEEAARDGIRQVSEALPESPGQLMVNNARGTVWSRPLPGTGGLPAGVELPSGAAFAALTLGFLDGNPAAVYRNGRWLRVSTGRGHVLVRSGASL